MPVLRAVLPTAKIAPLGCCWLSLAAVCYNARLEEVGGRLLDYRSRWQQKRRERVTRRRLIIIVAAVVAALVVALSWRGPARPAPSAYRLLGPDVCWLAAGPDFVLVCGRSGRLARIMPDLTLDGVGWGRDFTHPAGFLGRPALAPGLALLPCADVRLRAVDLATGLQAWEIEVGGAVCAVTADADRAYFGSEDGCLYAATAEGSVIWRSELGAKVVAPPLVTEDTVIAATLAGEVICVSRADGGEVWRVETDAPIYAAPRMGPSTILVGDDAGKLHNITREGEFVASFEFEGLVRAPVGVDGTVVVAGDSSGLLVRINPSDMTEMWRARLPGSIAVAPVVLGDTVWCAAGPSLVALNAETGGITARRIAEAETSDLIAAFGRVYWATTDGRVRVIDRP